MTLPSNPRDGWPYAFDVLAVLDIEGNAVRVLGLYFNDPKRAHEHAHNVSGVLVAVSPTVLGDYRPKGDS
jgi:hypothetical protein